MGSAHATFVDVLHALHAARWRSGRAVSCQNIRSSWEDSRAAGVGNMTTATTVCWWLPFLLALCCAGRCPRAKRCYHERVGGCQIKFAAKGNFTGQRQLNYMLCGPPVMAELGREQNHTERSDNSNLALHMA